MAGDADAPVAARRDLLTGIVIGLAALWAGIWRISTESVLFDEPAYASAGAAFFDGDFTENLEHPPVAKYLFGLGQQLLGEGIDSARVTSALASVVIALVLWRLGSKMLGPARGHRGRCAVGRAAPLHRLEGGPYARRPARALRLSRAGHRHVHGAGAVVRLAAQPAHGLARPGRVARCGRPGGGHRPGHRVEAVGCGCRLPRSGCTCWPPAVGAWSLRWVSPARCRWSPLGVAYVPFGRTAGDALSFMFRAQRDHASKGHMVFLRGEPTVDPPWYTELWYHLDADGVWLTAAVLGLVCVAFADPKRRRAVAYAFAAVVGLYLFLSLLPVQLRHYRYVVWPPLVLVLAAGATSVFGRLSRPWRAIGAASLAVVAVAGLVSLGRLATLAPQDYGALEQELRDRGVDADARVRVFGPYHVGGHSSARMGRAGAAAIRSPETTPSWCWSTRPTRCAGATRR